MPHEEGILHCTVHVFSNMPRKQSNWLDVYRIRAARIAQVRSIRCQIDSIRISSFEFFHEQS